MKIERLGEVALLRIETGKANAMNPTTIGLLDQTLRAVEADLPGALVVTGYGQFFSGGLDLASLTSLPRSDMRDFLKLFGQAMVRLFMLPRPVVAAINGHAIAGGCVLALQADRRLMVDEDVRIGLNEVQLGVGLPTIVTETVRCQVPPSSLFPICLEGRVMPPAEALALGLIDTVVPADKLLDRSVDLARTLAALPCAAYAQIKRSLRQGAMDLFERHLEAGLEVWLDTWFSATAKQRIAATVQRMAEKSARS